jgi:hypothetical protein
LNDRRVPGRYPEDVAESDNPVEQLVDALVYAPIGFALDAKQNWTKYVERGRSQVTLSRFVARTATKRGTAKAETFADRLLNEIGQVVVDVFGIDLSPDEDDRGATDAGATAISSFPIEGYDELTAAEIAAHLNELSPAQLRLIDAREREGKGRVTVLRRVESLLGAT